LALYIWTWFLLLVVDKFCDIVLFW